MVHSLANWGGLRQQISSLWRDFTKCKRIVPRFSRPGLTPSLPLQPTPTPHLTGVPHWSHNNGKDFTNLHSSQLMFHLNVALAHNNLFLYFIWLMLHGRMNLIVWCLNVLQLMCYINNKHIRTLTISNVIIFMYFLHITINNETNCDDYAEDY